LALALRVALAAAQAADGLAAASPPAAVGAPSPAELDAAQSLPDAAVVTAALLGATATEPGRRAVVSALLANGDAFQRLLQHMKVLANPVHSVHASVYSCSVFPCGMQARATIAGCMYIHACRM